MWLMDWSSSTMTRLRLSLPIAEWSGSGPEDRALVVAGVGRLATVEEVAAMAGLLASKWGVGSAVRC